MNEGRNENRFWSATIKILSNNPSNELWWWIIHQQNSIFVTTPFVMIQCLVNSFIDKFRPTEFSYKVGILVVKQYSLTFPICVPRRSLVNSGSQDKTCHQMILNMKILWYVLEWCPLFPCLECSIYCKFSNLSDQVQIRGLLKPGWTCHELDPRLGFLNWCDFSPHANDMIQMVEFRHWLFLQKVSCCRYDYHRCPRSFGCWVEPSLKDFA